MRLKQSRAAAEETLIALANRGYKLLAWMQADRLAQNPSYQTGMDEWITSVVRGLNDVFPTELEANTFINAPARPMVVVNNAQDYQRMELNHRLAGLLDSLGRITADSLGRYTELPIKSRLYIEDIDSFRKARDVNPAMVAELLNRHGRLDVSEEVVQTGFEKILEEPLHKKDWGGEKNDLYTCNMIVNGARTATAFLLKGNGLRRHVMQIRDCGANGDQLVRLFEAPATLFVVQFVGNVDESVIKDVEGKVAAKNLGGQEARFCIMNGQDTARILRAYRIL